MCVCVRRAAVPRDQAAALRPPPHPDRHADPEQRARAVGALRLPAAGPAGKRAAVPRALRPPDPAESRREELESRAGSRWGEGGADGKVGGRDEGGRKGRGIHQGTRVQKGTVDRLSCRYVMCPFRNILTARKKTFQKIY